MCLIQYSSVHAFNETTSPIHSFGYAATAAVVISSINTRYNRILDVIVIVTVTYILVTQMQLSI